jgi:hypothetical protein
MFGTTPTVAGGVPWTIQRKSTMDDRKSPLPSLTKDELNLAELPVSLSCHRAPKGRDSIHLAEQMLDKNGRLIRREWTVSGSSRYGLPLATDDEVLLGLAYFLRQSDFGHRQVYFTQYSLFRLLGWGDSQRSYERLEASLRRLAGVHLESRESFWDHKEQCFLTRGFGLIDNYVLYRKGSRQPFDQPYISSVTFNETIFESFRSGFVKTLDLDLFLSLRYPIARKLFRLLDKKLHKSPLYEIELMRLANRIALTDNAYPSVVKKHLAEPHEELIRVGFLKQAIYIRKGRSDTIRYVMNPRSEWRRPAARIAPATEHPLVRELASRGITRDVATSLLAHGEKAIADKLEFFDHLRSSNSPLLSKNPAGFLRASIEKNFAPPAGYISRAERQRRKDEEAVARRRERVIEEAADKSERERQEAFDALWTSLTHEERAQLEGEVLMTLNAFARKAYHQEKAAGRIGSGHHTLRTGVANLLLARRGLDVAGTTDSVRELA